MYLEQNVTKPRNDKTSYAFFGDAASRTACILVSEILMPSLDRTRDMNIKDDLLNSHLSWFNVKIFSHNLVRNIFKNFVMFFLVSCINNYVIYNVFAVGNILQDLLYDAFALKYF